MIDRFEKFSALIFDVSRNWHKITSNEMSKYNLKGTYAVYLFAMCRNPDGITAARLAEICCRDKADVSRAISSMETKGMITKISSNNNSYRAVIKLTDRGMNIANEIKKKGEVAVEMAGVGTTPAEKNVFYKVMETVSANLRYMSNHGIPEKSATIKAILFDLDGTLLPMDMDEFMEVYFAGICKKLKPLGYNSNELINVIQHGVRAMYRNNGDDTNENVFWRCFKAHYPDMTEKEIEYLNSYYDKDFDNISSVVTPNPDAKKAIDYIKSKGIRTVLATNPLFPRIATKKRIRWAGFEEKEFEFFTSFEDSNFTKPNPNYFRGIYERMGLKPCECLMVGNDVDEDMEAHELGMRVFLLTDHMINKNNKDISAFPHGDFNDLIEYIKEQAC